MAKVDDIVPMSVRAELYILDDSVACNYASFQAFGHS